MLGGARVEAMLVPSAALSPSPRRPQASEDKVKRLVKEIGREFEGRDHTTVLHSIERVEDFAKNDPEKAEIIKDITANINSCL